MFEILGTAVALFILWRIGIGFFKGIAATTRRKAKESACAQGVPEDFAAQTLSPDNYHVLKSAHKDIVAENPEIRTLDVYQQHAAAIVALYKLHEMNKNQGNA